MFGTWLYGIALGVLPCTVQCCIPCVWDDHKIQPAFTHLWEHSGKLWVLHLPCRMLDPGTWDCLWPAGTSSCCWCFGFKCRELDLVESKWSGYWFHFLMDGGRMKVRLGRFSLTSSWGRALLLLFWGGDEFPPDLITPTGMCSFWLGQKSAFALCPWSEALPVDFFFHETPCHHVQPQFIPISWDRKTRDWS